MRKVWTPAVVVLALGAMLMGSRVFAGDELPEADRYFATQAQQGSMAEVEMGRLALNKTSSERVKVFAQKMINEHSKVMDNLKEVAVRVRFKLPDYLATADSEEKAKLEKLSGKEFDFAYMNDMVRAHQEDVAKFDKEADSGQSPDLKHFARNNLALLKQQLVEAQTTLQDVKEHR